MIVVSTRHNHTSSRIIYQQSGRTKSLFEAHSSRHPTRRRRCLWWWWRGGEMVGIGVVGGLGGAVRRRLGGVAGGSTTLWCVVFIGADC